MNQEKDLVTNREAFLPNKSSIAAPLGDSSKSKVKAKQEAVAKGIVKKKGIFKRLSEDILGGDDLPTIGEHLLRDILIPAAKTVLVTMIKEGTEMYILGETRPRAKNPNNPNYIPSWQQGMNRHQPQNRTVPSRRTNLETIEFTTRDEAEQVLFMMYDLLSEYKIVTLADFYDLAGISKADITYMDGNIGWYNLSNTRVHENRDGYFYITLPRPVTIK